ncbi:hypothetical protein MOQ_002388, partial [Trypanosoma cruzi marinkellei]
KKRKKKKNKQKRRRRRREEEKSDMRYSFEQVAKKETGGFCRAVTVANATRSDVMKAYMQLAEAELRALPKQRRLLERLLVQSEEERRAVANERRQVALRRRDELKRKLQQFKEGKDGDDVRKTTSHDTYARQWAAVYSGLALRREQLAHVLSCLSTAAHITAFTDAVDSLAHFTSAVHRAITFLEDNKDMETFTPLSIQPLYTQLELVTKMQLQVTSLLNRERHTQFLLRENTAEFFKGQERLLAWCVEQQEALQDLKGLKDLREFCTSFMSNVAVMDTNFLVLLERSEKLASNKAVREALVAVNRTWMELAISVYHTIHEAIRREHANSGVEAACKWWIDTFEERLRRILVEACDITDHMEMQSEPLMQVIHRRSLEVLRDLALPHTISQHISDFTEREDSVAPHEEALREALVMRLSLLTLTFVGDAKYAGQREYADRLREVSDYLDAQATGVVYTQLLERVNKLRSMVEEQLRLLPAGKSVTAADA